MVGVEFDQSRQQKVAVEIHTAFGGGAIADLDNASVRHGNVTAIDDVVVQNDAGIGEKKGI